MGIVCGQLGFLVFIVVLAAKPVFTGYSWADPRRPWLKKDLSLSPPPEFDLTQSPVVTAVAGQTTLLPCTVHELGDRVVSWIRTKDLHILTSDVHLYTSDGRFEVVHPTDSDMWMLRINGTRLGDSGLYECQVNTDPKIKFPVSLTVIDSDQIRDSPYKSVGHGVEFQARISGPKEQLVPVGATVTFTCEVTAVSTLPSISPVHHPLIWTHGGRQVSFQAARGGISVDTDYRDNSATSRLTIALVTEEDSGNYTCSRNDAIPATMYLEVVEGEHSEAMQRDMSSISGNTILRATSCSFFIFLIQILFL